MYDECTQTALKLEIVEETHKEVKEELEDVLNRKENHEKLLGVRKSVEEYNQLVQGIYDFLEGIDTFEGDSPTIASPEPGTLAG